jgi:hypothetical protein
VFAELAASALARHQVKRAMLSPAMQRSSAWIAPDSPFFLSAYSSFSIFEGLVGSALVSEFLAIKIAARHVWWGEREQSCHILW